MKQPIEDENFTLQIEYNKVILITMKWSMGACTLNNFTLEILIGLNIFYFLLR